MPTSVTKPAGSGVPGGTPSASGNPQSGLNPNQSSDAQASAMNDLRTQIERLTNDINRLKSSSDRRFAQAQDQWNRERAELQTRLQQTATANMDEAGKAKYEQEMTRLRLEQAEAELQNYRNEQARNQQREQYVEMFAQYGVKREELDLSSDEALAQSGWEAVGRNVTAMQARLAQFESGQAPQPPVQPPANTPKVPEAPVAPPVFTGTGQAAPQGVHFNDMKKELGARYQRPISDEEIFKEMDRGRIDPSQIIP